jgi:hypothetical protein
MKLLDFSLEAWMENDFYQAGSSSAALLIDGARKAGLPICATPQQFGAGLLI